MPQTRDNWEQKAELTFDELVEIPAVFGMREKKPQVEQRYDELAAQIEKALHNPKQRLHLAEEMFSLSQGEGAEPRFRLNILQQAVRLDPFSLRYRVALARAEQELELLEEAIAEYMQALENWSDSPYVDLLLGEALLITGQTEKARRCFEQVSEENALIAPLWALLFEEDSDEFSDAVERFMQVHEGSALAGRVRARMDYYRIELGLQAAKEKEDWEEGLNALNDPVLPLVYQPVYNHYEVLELSPEDLQGLDEGAIRRKIQGAARKARRRYIKNAQKGDAEAIEKVAKINAAESILKYSEKRDKYDSRLMRTKEIEAHSEACIGLFCEKCLQVIIECGEETLRKRALELAAKQLGAHRADHPAYQLLRRIAQFNPHEPLSAQIEGTLDPKTRLHLADEMFSLSRERLLDPQTRLSVLQQAVRLDPFSLRYRVALAQAKRELGFLEEAVAEYRRCLEHWPDSPQIDLLLGEVLLEAGQTKAARKCFTKLLSKRQAQLACEKLQSIQGNVRMAYEIQVPLQAADSRITPDLQATEEKTDWAEVLDCAKIAADLRTAKDERDWNNLLQVLPKLGEELEKAKKRCEKASKEEDGRKDSLEALVKFERELGGDLQELETVARRYFGQVSSSMKVRATCNKIECDLRGAKEKKDWEKVIGSLEVLSVLFSDLYGILGLSLENLVELDDKKLTKEIRYAAKRVRRKYNKAAQKGDKEAEEKLTRLNEAEIVLKDPEKRRKHDEERRMYDEEQETIVGVFCEKCLKIVLECGEESLRKRVLELAEKTVGLDHAAHPAYQLLQRTAQFDPQVCFDNHYGILDLTPVDLMDLDDAAVVKKIQNAATRAQRRAARGGNKNAEKKKAKIKEARDALKDPEKREEHNSRLGLVTKQAEKGNGRLNGLLAAYLLTHKASVGTDDLDARLQNANVWRALVERQGGKWPGLHEAYLHELDKWATQEYEKGKKGWRLASALWQEAERVSPYNPPALQNLAIVHTRLADEGGYQWYWDRVTQVWTLHSEMMPEADGYRESLLQKHQAFVKGAQERLRSLQTWQEQLELGAIWAKEAVSFLALRQLKFRNPYFRCGVMTEDWAGDEERQEELLDAGCSSMQQQLDLITQWQGLGEDSDLTQWGYERLDTAKLIAIDSDEETHRFYEEEKEAFQGHREYLLNQYLILLFNIMMPVAEKLNLEDAKARSQYVLMGQCLLSFPHRLLRSSVTEIVKGLEESTDLYLLVQNCAIGPWFKRAQRLADQQEFEKAHRLLTEARELCQPEDEFLKHIDGFAEQIDMARVSKRLEKAQDRLRREETQEAILECQEALQDYPDHPYVFFILAQAYIGNLDIEEAKDALRQAQKVSKEGSDLLKAIEKNLGELEEYGPQIILSKAVPQMQAKQWSEAQQLLAKGRSLDPRSAQVTFYEAVCWGRMEDTDKAEQVAQEASQQCGRGESELKKEIKGFIEQLPMMLIAEDFAKAQKAMGRKRWRDALTHLDTALSKSPDAVPVLFYKALCHFQLKEWDEAERVAKKTQKHKPKDKHVKEQLKLMLEQIPMARIAKDMEKVQKAIKRKRWQEALGYLNSVLHQAPNHVVALFYKALCELRLGRKGDAKRTARKGLPHAHGAQYKQVRDQLNQIIQAADVPDWLEDMNKAVQAMNTKKWTRALEYLEKVINRDSTNAQAYYYRALCTHQGAMSRLSGGKKLTRSNVGSFISSFKDILSDLDRAERYCSYTDRGLASAISNLRDAAQSVLSQLHEA